MQKLSVSMVVVSALVLSACVSESTYVGSDRPVQQRQVDNTEAARTRMSLGLNYLQRGENAQAIYNLERARVLAPSLPEVYNALAYYYQSVNEPEQAENAYQQALARDADNPDTYNNYGAFLCQQAKYDEAEVLLLTAIRRPGYMRVSESYENLALCQLQQNNFSRAQHYLESAVLHSGNRISSLLNLAALDYAMGNHQRARQHLNRIQRLGHVSASTALLSYLIADKELDTATQKNARELLMQVYPDSEAARLMRQERLEDSEYEQLRERYKQYLISNLDLPEQPQQVATATEQPQIRIVRRNDSPAETTAPRQSESLARSQSEPAAAAKAEPASQPERSAARHEASSIAASLMSQIPMAALSDTIAQTDSPVAASDTEASALPVEPAVQAAEPAEIVRAQPDENELSVPELVHGSNPAAAKASEAAWSQQMPVAAQTQEALPAPDEVAYHLVQQGESLFAISMQYNLRLERLQEWNQLSPGATIRTGQRLWLAEPPLQQKPAEAEVHAERPDIHVVAQGDTLFNISMRYNVRLARVLQWNNLTEHSRVYVGQRIYLTDPADLTHDD